MTIGDITVAQAVVREKMLSARLGVSGSPIIVLQGKVYEGVPRDLDALIRNAVQNVGATP